MSDEEKREQIRQLNNRVIWLNRQSTDADNDELVRLEEEIHDLEEEIFELEEKLPND